MRGLQEAVLEMKACVQSVGLGLLRFLPAQRNGRDWRELLRNEDGENVLGTSGRCVVCAHTRSTQCLLGWSAQEGRFESAMPV